MRKVYLALFIALLPCIAPRVKHVLPNLKLDDFAVYDTASVLARQHQGSAIYEGADNGLDPQLRYADARTHFAAVARQLGAPVTQLYVYPPILADLLIPLSLLPLKTAAMLWTLFNYGQLVAVGALLISLLRLRWRSVESLVLCVGLFCAQPVVSCIVWGQITLFLALLWLWGMWLYREGWIRTSAAVFALAAAIKLVPLIAIIPFLIWKEWKWIRAFTLTILLLIVGMCLVNGPSTLMDFAFHVLPSMSHGIARTGNQTILAATQLVYILVSGGDVILGKPEVPRFVVSIGKACSLLALILAVMPLLKVGDKMSLPNRLMALAFLFMISGPIAPVTWPHGYIPSLIALTICWVQAFRAEISTGKLIFLAACTMAVSSYAIFGSISYLANHGKPGLVIVALAIFTPVAIVILALTNLASLKFNPPSGAFTTSSPPMSVI